ncbi:MAG: ergothioneine biosynthesis protein EgtB [Bacteriovorax sp.]
MLEDRYIALRKKTRSICERLEVEDMVVQPIPEVSPLKWHLGHTTWLLEELLLNKYDPNYRFFNEHFRKIFNSYYKSIGEHWIQEERGALSRPLVKEILNYRSAIDEKILTLVKKYADNKKFSYDLELAINHEEQHQELMFMDLKYVLSANPERPIYENALLPSFKKEGPKWARIPENLYEVGATRNDQFAFDNEMPRHKVYLATSFLSRQLVTNGEFLHFIEDKGYSRPMFWLSQGWDWVKAHNIHSPLYWIKTDEGWEEFTLYGKIKLDLNAPVAHVSYYEADAFSRWMGMRLPREEEFEVYESQFDRSEKTDSYFHPQNAEAFNSQLWCWTQSQYLPYPGFVPFEGLLTEYNGKFMCNQFVLKGGSFATPKGHYRNSYRNFFEPNQRWMFSGICLARDGQ